MLPQGWGTAASQNQGIFDKASGFHTAGSAVTAPLNNSWTSELGASYIGSLNVKGVIPSYGDILKKRNAFS